MADKKVKIIHIMADGKVVDSIEGAVVPVTPATINAYKILVNIAMKNATKTSNEG